jgi:hypothetical protein
VDSLGNQWVGIAEEVEASGCDLLATESQVVRPSQPPNASDKALAALNEI